MPSCSHCARPNAPTAAVCVHCGRRVRKAAAREPHQEIHCAACGNACDVVLLGELHLDLCRSCRGLWFDRGELEEFSEAISDTEFATQVEAVLGDLGRTLDGGRPAAYLSCPLCAATMRRTNYARVSGIVLDACDHHGFYAAHDDAVRLVGILAEGGEARLREIAERRDKEELDRTLRQLKSGQRENAARISSVDLRGRMHIWLDWFDIM